LWAGLAELEPESVLHARKVDGFQRCQKPLFRPLVMQRNNATRSYFRINRSAITGALRCCAFSVIGRRFLGRNIRGIPFDGPCVCFLSTAATNVGL
jgi:hypothetical protein